MTATIARLLVDSSGNEVGIVLDGTVYRLQTVGKVLNAAGTQVNPATEDTLATLATESKLEAVRALVASLDAKDFATQTTLASILADTAGIETILAAIRDTAGIKKITDPVAVTDNAGSLTVDTPQLPAALVGGRLDENLGAWLGSTAPTVGQKAMVASVPVTIASDQSALAVTTGNAAGTATVSKRLRTGGGAGAFSMVVDGSVTPVKFEFNADATSDIQLSSVRLVISAAFFNFNGVDFGKGGGSLPNGVTVDIVANNGAFTSTLTTLNVNEDFLRLLDFSVSQAGSTDVMAASLPFGANVVLEAGTADEISVTVNDNLTAGNRGISYFTATVYGDKL